MVKVFILFIFFTVNTLANDEFLLTRINTDFNNTWYSLYEEVKNKGYKTTYLQRCDFALNQRNYKSDKYRILFFGEYKNMEKLSKKYPKVVPFLPLKIIVMAEGENTILMANPISILLEIVKGEDIKVVNKWQQDLEDIFANVRQTYAE